eukprot:GEZU01029573.1.p1 GENE.GEZU01029573.1~~GEZU01029573.1.p1  ORF type:complete len:357 (-),score=121.60 GEZU01029573.1:12-1082(-)
MGCDGGVVVNARAFIVKEKKAPPKTDHNMLYQVYWTLCRLTKEQLKEPIVACDLGMLYNKEAVINALLEKKLGKKMPDEIAHIRSLKDVYDVKFTSNPDFSKKSDTDKAPYICPITLHEIKGQYKFVLVKTCGHVVSDRAVKEMSSSKSAAGTQQQQKQCLVCSAAYTDEKVIILDPSLSTEESIRERRDALLAKREQEAKAKKEAKKKAKSSSSAEKSAASSDEASAAAADNKADGITSPTDKKKESHKRKHKSDTGIPTTPTVAAAAAATAETDAKTKSDKAAAAREPIAKKPRRETKPASTEKQQPVPILSHEVLAAKSTVYSSLFASKTDKEVPRRNDFLVREGMRGPAYIQ